MNIVNPLLKTRGPPYTISGFVSDRDWTVLISASLNLVDKGSETTIIKNSDEACKKSINGGSETTSSSYVGIHFHVVKAIRLGKENKSKEEMNKYCRTCKVRLNRAKKRSKEAVWSLQEAIDIFTPVRTSMQAKERKLSLRFAHWARLF